MLKTLRLLFALFACLFTCSAMGAELGILEPVLENGKTLAKADPTGKPAPVLKRVRSGEIYDLLQKEAAKGYTRTTLALDEAAQRIAGQTPKTTWLYLSEEEGGFPRAGFWLREDTSGKTADRYLAEPFVDLIVDPGSIRAGDFEEIFAHEMGHIYLRRLLPTLPPGYSRTAHASMSVTDSPTAFDEGFATHFQGLVRRLTGNQVLRDTELGLEYKPFVSYWLSNIDRAGRIEGVRRNWFVQAQVTLPGDGDALARFEKSSLFDTARLRNGNQMLASEGVIATLFYRWLVPGSGEREAIVERYSRLFSALAALNKSARLSPDSVVFLDLLDKYVELFPEEAGRVTGVFVDTTYGATADPALARATEALAATGRIGDIESFVGGLKASRASLAELRADVARAPRKLRAALGPDLWLLVGELKPGAEDTRLAVNLNTAEREALMKVPGIDGAVADRALDSRRRAGMFRDLTDFSLRSGLASQPPRALADMMQAMQKAGPYERR